MSKIENIVLLGLFVVVEIIDDDCRLFSSWFFSFRQYYWNRS